MECKYECGRDVGLNDPTRCDQCLSAGRFLAELNDLNAIQNIVDDLRPVWTPFVKTELFEAHHTAGLDPRLIAYAREGDTFVNSRYQVQIRVEEGTARTDGRPVIWISIKTLWKDARHDWRDFQRIKNELVGQDAEGIELYPAEGRLVDTANQYHVWCIANANVPVGFDTRLVAEGSQMNAKQRPFEDDSHPAGATPLSRDAMNRIFAAMLQEKERNG